MDRVVTGSSAVRSVGLIAALAALLAAGCIDPEAKCAEACGGRGYRYDNGAGWYKRPASCVCGPAVADGGAR